jgi:hypothetical protein
MPITPLPCFFYHIKIEEGAIKLHVMMKKYHSKNQQQCGEGKKYEV